MDTTVIKIPLTLTQYDLYEQIQWNFLLKGKGISVINLNLSYPYDKISAYLMYTISLNSYAQAVSQLTSPLTLVQAPGTLSLPLMKLWSSWALRSQLIWKQSNNNIFLKSHHNCFMRNSNVKAMHDTNSNTRSIPQSQAALCYIILRWKVELGLY